MNSLKMLGTALVAGLALVSASAVQAAPIISNPSFTVGAFTFDTFNVSVTSNGNAAPIANSAVNVDLIPGGSGVQFSSGFTTLNGGFSDAAITYVAHGTAGLTSVGLSFDGYFMGQAIAAVTETIFADAARTVLAGQARVSCGVVGGCTLSDVVTLTGSYDTLYITKDINVTSFTGGLAQTSIINQTFTPVAVPEPMSLALFGSGLLGLGLVRRARKSS